MRIRFVNRWARTKRMWRRFVWRFVLSAQNESCTPGLVSFCAPLKGGAHKTKRLKSGVPRAKTWRKTKRPPFAHVGRRRVQPSQVAQTYHPSPRPNRGQPRNQGGGRHGSFPGRYRPEMAAGTAAIVD